MAGRRVLVLGGEHQQAAALRSEIAAKGGSPAVNLSANVTDIVVLPGGEHDPRLDRARQAGVRIHHDAAGIGLSASLLLEPHVAPEPASAEPAQATTAVLSRGSVIDLPPGDVWTINVAWRADALADCAEVDLVAFMLDDTGRVASDEDFVYFNAPISETGAVALSVDGDSEQSIRLDLGLLEHTSRVVVVAALTGTSTFGELGAVAVSIDDEERLPVATATLDAGTVETTMIISEFYRRRGCWRVRAVGQGYDDGLAALVTRYGVEVA